MSNPTAPALESALTDRFHFGQILVRKINGAFVLSHCGDETRKKLKTFQSAEDAIELSKFDDSGNYRPLKTAPNLARGWRLELARPEELQRALDYFYPGRLAVFLAWKTGQLHTTPLRETLDRQSGMYRVAAKISDDQIDGPAGVIRLRRDYGGQDDPGDGDNSAAVPGAMQSARGGMPEDGERQGLTVAALYERRIIFV